MKLVLDTNVLIATLIAQGVCADLVEHGVLCHSIVTSEFILEELRIQLAADLKTSARGEPEITDVIRAYLRQGQLHTQVLSRGFAWLDTGTPEALLQAANFVQTFEQRQGLKIARIEEIAYRKKFITASELQTLASGLGNDYGR